MRHLISQCSKGGVLKVVFFWRENLEQDGCTAISWLFLAILMIGLMPCLLPTNICTRKQQLPMVYPSKIYAHNPTRKKNWCWWALLWSILHSQISLPKSFSSTFIYYFVMGWTHTLKLNGSYSLRIWIQSTEVHFCIGSLAQQPRFGFGISNVALLSNIPRFLYPWRRLTPTSKFMNTSNISRPCFAIVGCQDLTYLQKSKQWDSRGSMPKSSALPTISRVMFSNVTASLMTATPSHYTFGTSLRLRIVLTRDTLLSIVAACTCLTASWMSTIKSGSTTSTCLPSFP